MQNNGIFKFFGKIEDVRANNHNKRHELIDIIITAVLANICGANNYVEIEDFALAKVDWLKTFLKLVPPVLGIWT